MPEDNVPVDETTVVPEKAFGPLMHVLLFASRAVILTAKGIPVTCEPIFPPEDNSTKKLLTEPAFTVIEEFVLPKTAPSVTAIAADSALFNIVLNKVEETPLAKLTDLV